jgi:hypothetical protein
MTAMLVMIMIQWGAITAWLARSKRRNLAAWFAIGALLPVIGVGVVLAMPVKPKAAPRPRKRQGNSPSASQSSPLYSVTVAMNPSRSGA